MRKTKIVATIGPACDSPDQIRQMIEAGVNVFRFNMKHSDLEWHSQRMERVELACAELKKRVAILMDLQGPEVRISEVPEQVADGETGRGGAVLPPWSGRDNVRSSQCV
jgi:pyruvate kinase